jgi:hypothetical protein
MKSRASLKRAVAAVAVGVIIGGGVTIVTPAGAEVSQFAATNWKKIWKKKLQPQADKRYYTKAASDTKYAAAGSAYSKAEVEAKLGGYYTKAQADAALGGYYTKAQADAKYQPVGNYAAAGSSYTKAESDAKYAPAQPLYRGTFMLAGTASGITHYSQSISFGATFSVAPTTHYIQQGGLLPAGCSGTAAAPNAQAGHLCVFEGFKSGANWAANRGICNSTGNCSSSNTYGAAVYAYTTGAGFGEIMGSWAARPAAVVNPSIAKPTSESASEGSGSQ